MTARDPRAVAAVAAHLGVPPADVLAHPASFAESAAAFDFALRDLGALLAVKGDNVARFLRRHR